MKKSWFFLILSFLCMGMMHAQENYFTPDGMTGSSIAMFWCEVRIDGVAQTSGDIEVAEFVDGSCRYVTRIEGYYSNTYYRALINGQIDGEGKIVTFKCYDHNTGIEYAECPYTYTSTGATDQVGTAVNPVILEFTTPSFDKLIVGYGDNANGYYLIASPLADEVDPTTIDGMILTGDDAANYDLYAFNQGAVLEWANYKENSFNLVNGKGYLYAKKNTVTLTFTGRPYSGNGEVTLTKAEEAEGLDFPAWNLVGNPFPVPAYITKAYYYMNEVTSEIIMVESPSSRAVDKMEGVFVVADTNLETLVFSTEVPSRNPAVLVMNLTSNRSNGVIDRAVVDFNQDLQMAKFMLDGENTNISIMQGDEAYAMVHSNGQGELPVNFKARTDGSYTLNVNPKNIEMGYLHLVDNFTGDDIDLLETPSYTFVASAGDAESRFMLKFATRNHWVPVGTQGNASLIALVQINGVNIEDGTNWELGAFNEYDVCRGVGSIENGWASVNDPGVPYPYYMMTVINGESGEQISFKLYDRANGEVSPGVCDVVMTWHADEMWGTLWDPVVLNFLVPQSYTKEIEGYGENAGGYYLIASPLLDAVTPTAENGFLVNDYDLYRFNQASSLEWENWENDESTHYQFDLVSGKGYLYANSVGTTLTFTGYPYSGNGEVTLTKAEETEGLDFPAWNLVGNPFPNTAYLPTGRSFYSMQNADNFTPETGGGNTPIGAMNGVFVIASDNNETLTFSTTAPGKASKLVMNLSNNRGSFLDRAIVSFDEGSQLPKLQLRSGSTKVYIPQNNVDYAVVNSEEVGAIPVNFKAESNGTYTLSFTNEEVNFAYLHLIDNMTGVETDLLANPSYSFEAKATDYESRFKLVFATGNNSTDDNFAFYSNGSFVINNEGEATLQVIDVNGRILKSESINGCANINVNAVSGIYMLRLVNGENVKIQKVVVR